MPRSYRCLPLLLGLAALGISQPRAQAQTVIYSDTFARGTVATPLDLNGSTPDTASDLYGGTSGATWAGTSGDWIMAGSGAAATRDTGFTSLPFSPLPSTVYTVDWTWTVGSGTPWWIIGLQTAWDHMTVTGNVRNSITGTNHAVVTLITDATTGYTTHVVFNGATPWPDTFGLRSAITRIGFIQQAGGSNTAVMTSMSLTVANAAPTPSTTALARNPLNPLTTSTYGGPLSFDVTVAEDGGPGIPSGPVILKDGTTPIGRAVDLDAAGKCTITTSTLAVGEYSEIVAVYGGDSTYAGSTSSALSTQTVSPKPLTVTATGPAKPFGTPLTTGPSTINFTADPTGVASEAVTSVTLTPDDAGLSPTTPVGDPYTVTPSLATGSNGFLAGNYDLTYIAYNGTVTEAPPPPPAGTIYLDTFARSGDLNGSTPDYSSGLDGGTSGATWTAKPGDWIMNGAGASAQRDCEFAWLPFSPVANTVYTLDVRLMVTPN
ncbi:MAG: Ig-like domain-containing protein [Verrucomicrobia bacterium]|nr:Ig-like domain-containing protein [Verrucomicrobiota bacterium]